MMPQKNQGSNEIGKKQLSHLCLVLSHSLASLSFSTALIFLPAISSPDRPKTALLPPSLLLEGSRAEGFAGTHPPARLKWLLQW